MNMKSAAQQADSCLSLNTKGANSASPLSPKKSKQTKTTTVKIFNLHSNNIREAEGFKVISHEEYDRDGKLRTNQYVEYMIIGKNRKWEDFMTVKEFKKLNPKVKVKGLN
ncbi:MAG: hypothetical protein ABIC96_03920 [Patescibacteria group bacterium]